MDTQSFVNHFMRMNKHIVWLRTKLAILEYTGMDDSNIASWYAKVGLYNIKIKQYYRLREKLLKSYALEKIA